MVRIRLLELRGSAYEPGLRDFSSGEFHQCRSQSLQIRPAERLENNFTVKCSTVQSHSLEIADHRRSFQITLRSGKLLCDKEI